MQEADYLHIKYSYFIFQSCCHIPWGGGTTCQMELHVKYRVRQRGCSLTHNARTPPAVHQGITIWVDEIEFEKK